MPGTTIFIMLACSLMWAADAFEKDSEEYEYAEHRLIRDLLRGYNKFAHPKSYIVDDSSNFTVIFGIEIVQLVDVEDRNQRIITNCWVRQKWTNIAFQWKPSDYDNITKITISGEKVWTPDILLYNSADTHQPSGGPAKYHTQIIINHEGVHSWYTPTSFISTCKINVRYFPFDRQECIMKFGSWTFQVKDLDIVRDSNPILTDQLLRNAEWDLMGVREKRNVKRYACCEFPFSDLTISLVIRRRPLFYIFNLMIPCFIIIAMVLMGFLLPPESGERTTLSITVLLAMAVFLQLQAEHLPRNSEQIPLLGIFYITVMAEVGLSLMATCYVLNIYHKNPGVHIVPMSPLVSRFFFGTMAPLLRLSPPTSDGSPYEPDRDRARPRSTRRNDLANSSALSETQVNLLGETSERVELMESVHTPPGGTGRLTRNIRPRYSPTKRPLTTSMSASLIVGTDSSSPASRVSHCCTVLAERVKQKRMVRLDQERWRYLAMILDRIFFFLFIVTIFISTVLIYSQVKFHEI